MKQSNAISTKPNNRTAYLHFSPLRLKILAVIANGLNNLNKRVNIFNLLKTKKIDLALLQEIDSTKTTETQWQKEWTRKSFWN